MNKLIIPFLFIACFFVTACSDDEPKDKTKDIQMLVSEEPGVMFGPFNEDGKNPIMCLRVQDEDFPNEWRNLSMSAIEGFKYQIGHRYTLRVRRTILANPPADASSYTYKLLEINEDRVWPPVDEPKEEIIVNKEEDIPYAEKCPYHIYDVYRNGDFVVGKDGRIRYQGYDMSMDFDYVAVRLEFAIPKESPDFLEFNKWGKMAYYAYVMSPLTDKIEKVRLDSYVLYLKDVIREELFKRIVEKYESGKTLEYNLVFANIHGYGLQKVTVTITKE